MTVSVKLRPFRYSHTVGMLALTGKGFSNPIDVALGRNDLVYVLNRSNSFQAPMGAVRVGICTLDEEYVGQFGSFGTDDGQFTWPTSLAIDADGNVFVVDDLNNRIQRFTPEGKLLHVFGSAGEGPGEFNLPWGITTDKAGQIYVADWRNDRVQKFTSG